MLSDKTDSRPVRFFVIEPGRSKTTLMIQEKECFSSHESHKI